MDRRRDDPQTPTLQTRKQKPERRGTNAHLIDLGLGLNASCNADGHRIKRQAHTDCQNGGKGDGRFGATAVGAHERDAVNVRTLFIQPFKPLLVSPYAQQRRARHCNAECLDDAAEGRNRNVCRTAKKQKRVALPVVSFSVAVIYDTTSERCPWPAHSSKRV